MRAVVHFGLLELLAAMFYADSMAVKIKVRKCTLLHLPPLFYPEP
jgi:hypothetical protein